MWGQSMGKAQLGMAQSHVKAGTWGCGFNHSLADKGGCQVLTLLVVSRILEAGWLGGSVLYKLSAALLGSSSQNSAAGRWTSWR